MYKLETNIPHQHIIGVYKIENLKNNKIYIGSSKDIYYRLARHKSDLLKNKHGNSHLQSSFNKNGLDNFYVEIIEICSIDILLQREKYWINTLNPHYNMTKDPINIVITEEQKLQISNTLKEGYKTGRILPTRNRELVVYDLNGNFIAEYKYRIQAVKDLNLSQRNLHRHLTGKIVHCTGYQIFYKNGLINPGIIKCYNKNYRGELYTNCTKLPMPD